MIVVGIIIFIRDISSFLEVLQIRYIYLMYDIIKISSLNTEPAELNCIRKLSVITQYIQICHTL